MPDLNKITKSHSRKEKPVTIFQKLISQKENVSKIFHFPIFHKKLNNIKLEKKKHIHWIIIERNKI